MIRGSGSGEKHQRNVQLRFEKLHFHVNSKQTCFFFWFFRHRLKKNFFIQIANYRIHWVVDSTGVMETANYQCITICNQISRRSTALWDQNRFEMGKILRRVTDIGERKKNTNYRKLRLMRLLLAQSTATICSIGHNHMQGEHKNDDKKWQTVEENKERKMKSNYVDDSTTCLQGLGAIDLFDHTSTEAAPAPKPCFCKM